MINPINTIANAIVSVVAAGVIVLGSCAVASSASADAISSTHTKVVSYADLNLDSAAGASTFYSRIRAAARDVCSSYDGRDVSSTMLRQQCFERAVSSSVRQVNKASVTALHDQAVGRAS